MKFFLNDNITKKNFFLKKNLKIYLCGPTVYNYVHIGNVRPIIVFDVLCRALRFSKYRVHFLHNITDVDDKIINESIKLNKTEKEISDFFYTDYLSILKKLNIDLFFQIEKVTDNMSSIIEYIKNINNNGYAYEKNGDLYFNTQKIKEYGFISKQKINNTILNSRKIISNEKLNNNDFVLWKKTSKGIQWESPWSSGRPGWHTECSCLISKYLGQSIDIHGGGIDLKFPHHENENAQNIAVNSKSLSKIWLHVGHVLVDNEKMSKSLNNYYLVKDLLNKFDANSLRWSFYKTNYSNPLNFSMKYIEESSDEINFVINSLNKAKSYLIIFNKFKKINSKNFNKKYLKFLYSNLNITNHISFINNTVTRLNTFLKESKFSKVNSLYWDVFYMLKILGIKISNIHSKKNIRILLEWNKQKILKNFKISDNLRTKIIENKLI